MKKFFVLFLAVFFCLTLSLTSVLADSEELLLNGGFESGTDNWLMGIDGTLTVHQSLDEITPRSGNNFLTYTNRYGEADSPKQLVHN